MDATNDGAESVDQFLARIASLSSKQGQEEVERSKRAEEEMLQARKERQARRAERARSLSPSKTGPSPSLRMIGETTPSRSRGIEPPVALTPPSQSLTLGRSSSTSPKSEHPQLSSLEFARPLPPQPFHDRSSTPSVPANATSLSRSGTLSWNQRPTSRVAGSVRARPQSVASIPDTFTDLVATSTQKPPEEMSRKDIAASLASKDPAWFRQTADRGIGSAAYRKNEFDSDATTSFTNRGVKLPGMSKDSTAVAVSEPQKPTPPPSPLKTVSTLPLKQRSDTDQTSPARPASMISLSSKSPVLDLPSFKPLDLSNTADGDSMGLGRTPSILSSAGRPPSPTKGLGGFVQSAMMKRSDSVNKRWSVQANAGLKRGDSVATSRPAHLAGVAGFTPSHSRNSSRDNRIVKEGNSSPLSTSRPVSSHGSDPVSVTRGRPLPRQQDESASPSKDRAVSEQDDNPPESPVRQSNRPTTPPPPETLLSRSPSKTLDSRRWSPTKASWLESALNKPESPRFAPAKSETPAWKLNMQRPKELQSQSSESIRDSQKPAIAAKPLRSPPLGQKPPVRDSSSDDIRTKTADKSAVPTSETDTSVKTPLKTPPSATDATDSSAAKPAVPSKRNITPVTTEADRKSGDQTPSATARADEPPISSSNKVSSPEGKSEFKTPVLKSKPQTPPKTDFRASLKSRQAPSAANENAEPEFKAVFGKLKRTQTQNYVAPDVLKTNITQGKAALNTTGGPQPSKRVDEFKESILQKKEAMKAGGGSLGKRPESLNTAKPSEPVPEALAKRVALHKTGPSSESIDVKKVFDDKPAPRPLSRDLPPKPAPLKKEALTSQISPMIEAARSLSEDSISSKVGSTPISDTNSTPTLRKTNTNPESIKAVNTTQPSTETGFKARLPETSKLAARLNPALAGILSRSGSPRPAEDAAPNTGISTNAQDPRQSSGGTELTHVTKGRAKGPKRRTPKASSAGTERAISSEVKAAPRSEPAPAKVAPSPSPKPYISSPAPTKVAAANNTEASEQSRGPKPTPRKPSANIGLPKSAENQDEKPAVAPVDKSKGTPVEKSTPEVVSARVDPKQPSLKPKPLVTVKSAESRPEPKPLMSKPMENESFGKTATPKKFAVLPDRPTNVSSPPESDGEKHLPSLSPPTLNSQPLTPSKSKLNTPRSQPALENANKSAPASAAPSKVKGLGLQLESSSRKVTATPELTPPPESESISSRHRPLPGKPTAPEKSPSKVKTQLQTFFGSIPETGEKAEFDTQAFLASQNKPTDKAKTIAKQIWEVTGDGKRTPMPPQQDHILFEECMYLCVHTMQSLGGSKISETYLWCGDEVPEAAIEDAQLFCRKIARDNSAKLEVVKQGKESSEFFQALGGIVIIRKNKSSALYMLCGRRHLGHVAFDEVEFTASNLCSGFPFLISAKFGKLYLWKGAGSNPEDVGCARLIGMDLGLTGEIEEISEGAEPAGFWESFTPRGQRPATSGDLASAEHSKGHSSRLYRVEHDRPKSSGGFWGLRAASPPKQSLKALVEEVSPFTQKDLDVNHIHILDTYSAVYVVIGSSAKKPAEFITALQIAQEIAVLGPSVQDRPLIPSCYVLLGEPPQEVKTIFRKWSPSKASLDGNRVCVRLEEVAQALGLSL